MNTVNGATQSAADKRKQLIELFLERTLEDVDHMRRSVPQLISSDQAAWQELRFAAQRSAGMAKSLDLGVLGACATELGALADEKFSGATLDARFLLSVTSSIEMVAIELNRLVREGY